MKHILLAIAISSFLFACEQGQNVYKHRCVPLVEYKQEKLQCTRSEDCPISPDLCQRVFCDWNGTCASLVPFEGENMGACPDGQVCSESGCCVDASDAEVSQ
jgi:hypothetical protein